MRLLRFTTYDVAVDLGTANTVVYTRGRVAVCEPSLVAVDAQTNEPLAVGSEALNPLGGEEISLIRPLECGVIADLTATEVMLRHFITKAHRSRRRRPRMIASVPSGVSKVHRRAVAEACIAAGAGETYLIVKPLAAALGTGLPVEQPTGSMVLDIGAGTSEVAVISMGTIVASCMLPIGGDELDAAIASHLKRAHRVLIGARTAEQIKFQIGSAFPDGEQAETEIVGRDISSDRLATVRLTSTEIRGALDKPLKRIIEAVLETLTRTPPQLACDIMEHGITLAGGSSLLHGLPKRLSLETAMPARLADAPSTCVAIGSTKSIT